MSAAAAAVRRWWFPALPLSRLAVLRTLVYLYVPVDLFIRTQQVVPKAYGSAALYAPVDALRLVHQPAPGPVFAQTLRAVVIASSLVAATGVAPRLLGWLVAVTFADWTCLAMSYGKVDHDHLSILVAVLVLPTVAGARWRSDRDSEAAGWALRCVEVAVVATYVLSAYAKVRLAGWHWVDGAIFAWAVVRRGTSLSRPLLHHPLVLLLSQWGLFAVECSSPLILVVRQKWRTLAVVGLLTFHVITWLTLTINFAPQMVCLAVLLPLERVPALTARLAASVRPRWARWRPSPARPG